MRQAIILAGGKGTRLASRLNGLPKPLVDVDGIPLLERQLRQLAAAGFEEAVVLVSHQREAIEAFCARTEIPNMRVIVRNDGETPRGTAGAVYDARDLLAERFLVVYGDTLFDIELDRFWKFHDTAVKEGALGTLFLHPNDHPRDSDLVDMRPDGVISRFYPKPHVPGVCHRNLVNAALYVFEKRLVMDFPPGEGIVDYGQDLLPEVALAGSFLRGYVTFEYIKDLGTPERLDRVTADLRSGKVARARLSYPQKAVFLDRDGTLNALNGHIASPEALEVFAGAGAAVRKLNRAEYRCVLITNQPVIARGDCSVESLERIHARLESELGEAGAFLDAIYYCPHHPDSGYAGEVPELKVVCTCRKPAPGLVKKAVQDLSIDLAQSWFVGDSAADVGAARTAGVRSILVRSGGLTATALPELPDYEVDDIEAAAWLVLEGVAAARAAWAPWLALIRPGTMVRIAGRALAGRSILAAALRQSLAEKGIAAAYLRLDHWSKPVACRPTWEERRADYDLNAANAALAGWRNGGALDIVVPCYNPHSGTTSPDGAHVALPAYGVLIVEGAFAFCIDAAPRRDLSVFADAPVPDQQVHLQEYLLHGLNPMQAEEAYRAYLKITLQEIEDFRRTAHGIITMAQRENTEK